MPAAHPSEFRRRALDVVPEGNRVAQATRDPASSESCLPNSRNRKAVDSGRRAGVMTDEHKELVELRRVVYRRDVRNRPSGPLAWAIHSSMTTWSRRGACPP